MNLARRLRVRGLYAAALLGLSAGGSYAADATPAPVAAPAVEGMPACESCAAAGCQTCQGGAGCHKSFLGGHLHTKKLHVPYLCPGACFGYFQTKWNRWEDVCNHYYQGVNVSDAPKAPIPAAKQAPLPKGSGGTGPMPTPMPLPDGKAPTGSPLPAPSVVPPAPKGVEVPPPPSVVPPTKGADFPSPLPSDSGSKFSR